MRRLVCVIVAALALAASASISLASAEQVEESWRSPFGTFRGIAVNQLDGSCWVSSGSRVLHLGPDGQGLAQVSGLVQPMGVAVNESDGSCWVAEEGRSQVLHVAAGGTVLATVPGLRASLVAVNPTNGSCAVTVANLGSDFYEDHTYEFVGLACLAGDGTELWRADVGTVTALAASPADGAWWLVVPSTRTASAEVIRVRADGTEAWRRDINADSLRLRPTSLSVNANDGTAWVSDGHNLIHLSAGGGELGRVAGDEFVSVSVDSSDGSLWISGWAGAWSWGGVAHLSADGTELFWDFSFPSAVPVASPADGSCWLLDGSWLNGVWQLPLLTSTAVAHLAADGTHLWRAQSARPMGGVASNPLDGSCWVGLPPADWGPADLVQLAPDGTEAQRVGPGGGPVAVNAADGSVWVLGNGLRHWSADGTALLLSLPSFPYANAIAVDPTDGSCWAVAGETVETAAAGRTTVVIQPGEVIHVAEDGTILLRMEGFVEPGSVSVDPGDGSCWLADRGSLIHLARDGTELLRTGEGCAWVSVDPVDGSCWAAGSGSVARLARDGSELWRRDGYDTGPLSVNAADGSCWMASGSITPTRVVHFAAGGTELWVNTDVAPDPYVTGPTADQVISVNPRDGSCWVADHANAELVRFAVVGYPEQHFGDVLMRHWAFAEVEACVAADIVQGYPDGSYRPQLSVTRDQMAVYISRALAGGDEGVQVPSGLAEPTFTDVGEEHWAYRYVEYCAGANIVEGYPDGGYHPDAVVNRGQMAVYIARALVAPSGDAAVPDPPAEPTFPDVTAESDWSWCYPHVEYCAAEGVVQGYWDGTYRPAQAVTRDQMAVYIARAFALPL
jgi:hypothetical protein